jgi:hypothetical protein
MNENSSADYLKNKLARFLNVSDLDFGGIAMLIIAQYPIWRVIFLSRDCPFHLNGTFPLRSRPTTNDAKTMKPAAQMILLLLGMVFYPFATLKVQAQTVDWGTSYSENPLSFLSDGTVDDQVLSWQLGWFADGFTPDQTNYLAWAVNWNPVDTNAHTFFADPSLPSGGLWSVAGHVDNVGVEAGGKQQYLFAYNSLGLLGTTSGEAFLARQDGLLFPQGPTANVFDIADFPLSSDDDLFTVIWGRVDREMYDVGGVSVGGGEFSSVVPDSTATPPDSLNGTFEVQSATWPIPEPSSALLLMLVGFKFMLRRR